MNLPVQRLFVRPRFFRVLRFRAIHRSMSIEGDGRNLYFVRVFHLIPGLCTYHDLADER